MSKHDTIFMELPLGGSVTLIKEGDAMVTYEALFAYSLVIIAIVTLCYKVFKDRDE